MSSITPKIREALLLAFHAPEGRLVRCKGGYGRMGEPTAGVATIRTLNTMQGANLVDFDQPMFPTCARLTSKGLELAEQLQPATAKAGAA